MGKNLVKWKPYGWLFPISCGLIVLLIYAPGFNGGFAFDDFPNLVNNEHLAGVNCLSSMWQATFTNVSGPLGRPVGMLTFAINAYFTGLDPWWMKLTNLGIHLLNAWLVFLLAGRLVPLLSRSSLDPTETRLLAAVVALIWAIHPINLTSVTYIIQRFNSLATFFSLLALLAYLRARMTTYPSSSITSNDSVPSSIYYGLFLLLALIALFAKENAVLIPIFILVIETFALHFSSTSPFHFRFLKTTAILIVAFIVLGFLYVLIFRPSYLIGGYQLREFTLGERLLTEGRVVCWYLWMIVLPNIQQMSLYHDDLVLSTGLLSPLTTLLALVAIAGLTAAGWMLRLRLPALGFAVFWFFGGHLLESTVIPLELAFEHRNYLPSVGVVLGLAVLLRDLLARVERRRVILGVMAVVATSLFAFSTWNRSQNWSDPFLTPVVEAHNNPDSPRAHIEAGLIYSLVAKQTKNEHDHTKFIQSGAEHYNRARQLQPESPNPLFGEIMLYYENGLEPPPELLPALQTRLEHGFIDATTRGGIQVLVECWFAGTCRFSDTTLTSLLQGILDNPRSPSAIKNVVLFYLAKFHAEKIGDRETAISLLKQALALSPGANNYRMSLVNLMIAQGHTAEARRELDELAKRDHQRMYRQQIDQAAHGLMNPHTGRSIKP